MKKTITSDEYRAFLRLLVNYRERAGLTQAQLAERLEETQSFVSKLERGERRVDVLEFLIICGVLDVSPEDFLVAFRRATQGGR